MTTCGWLGDGEHSMVCPWPRTTSEQIDWLCVHGSSLVLSWDSDAEMWELSWINLGKRHTAVSRGLVTALERLYDVGVLELA